MVFYGTTTYGSGAKYGANSVIDEPLILSGFDVYGNSTAAAQVNATVTILTGGNLQLQKSTTADIDINEEITVEGSGRLDLEVASWSDVDVASGKPITVLPGGKVEVDNKTVTVLEGTILAIEPKVPSTDRKLI